MRGKQSTTRVRWPYNTVPSCILLYAKIFYSSGIQKKNVSCKESNKPFHFLADLTKNLKKKETLCMEINAKFNIF